MKEKTFWMILADEFPTFCGWRKVNVKVGRKWVHLSLLTSDPEQRNKRKRMRIREWEDFVKAGRVCKEWARRDTAITDAENLE